MPPHTEGPGSKPSSHYEKLSVDLPDIESILILNPRKQEHANIIPTSGIEDLLFS